jgi:hypothetical protein
MSLKHFDGTEGIVGNFSLIIPQGHTFTKYTLACKVKDQNRFTEN